MWVYGYAQFKSRCVPIRVPEGIEICRAEPGDSVHMAGLSYLIYRELEKAPYWRPTPPEMWDDLREGWAELVDNEKVNVCLAGVRD